MKEAGIYFCILKYHSGYHKIIAKNLYSAYK